MRIRYHFSENYISNKLKLVGIITPLNKKDRKKASQAFNRGLSNGLECIEDPTYSKDDCLNSRCYKIGYDIGSICEQDFLIDDLAVPLVIIAQRNDIVELTKKFAMVLGTTYK